MKPLLVKGFRVFIPTVIVGYLHHFRCSIVFQMGKNFLLMLVVFIRKAQKTQQKGWVTEE
jgi:hypothetical protein